MEDLADLLRQLPWFGWVAIVAVIGGTFHSVIKSRHRHEERMAMIKQGMDPEKKKT